MHAIVKVRSVTETPSNSIGDNPDKGKLVVVMVVEVGTDHEVAWLAEAVGSAVKVEDLP